MEYAFAALRFCEDKNLTDRVYWYLAPFPVRTGDRVLAPVGSHDRLQLAEVVRTLSATEEAAPYDLRLVKRIAAHYGARCLQLSRGSCTELGGLRYDEKHFTRFGAGLCLREGSVGAEDGALLRDYGVAAVVDGTEDEDPFCERECGMALLRRLAAERECLLLAGASRETAAILWLLAGVRETQVLAECARIGFDGNRAVSVALYRGGAEAYLRDIGLTSGETEKLAERLR